MLFDIDLIHVPCYIGTERIETMADRTIRIVTHSGMPHADEILSIALVMLKEGILSPYCLDIERVGDCKASEMTEAVCKGCQQLRYKCACESGFADSGLTVHGSLPADFVIDVGGACDPRKGWFDHHHMDRDSKAACSFTLLASKKYKIELSRFLWAEKLAVIDSKGPKEWYIRTHGHVAKSGVEMARANGASDSFFSYLADVGATDFRLAVRMAKDWLQLQFENQERRSKDQEEARKTMRIVDLGNCGTGPAKMVFFDRKDASGILAVSDDCVDEDPSIVVSAMLDDRGDGYSAFRMSDTRVDFTPRAEEDDCRFAHKGGFLLKWKKDWDGFVDAVKRSIDEQARFEQAVEEFEEKLPEGEDVDWEKNEEERK